ncbi:MAG: hypothetical protein WCQ23_06115 [Candidatus Methanomethylophilaceae archaeon]|jgi:hypothetical protein
MSGIHRNDKCMFTIAIIAALAMVAFSGVVLTTDDSLAATTVEYSNEDGSTVAYTDYGTYIQ